jgi:hypothetical protein
MGFRKCRSGGLQKVSLRRSHGTCHAAEGLACRYGLSEVLSAQVFSAWWRGPVGALEVDRTPKGQPLGVERISRMRVFPYPYRGEVVHFRQDV